MAPFRIEELPGELRNAIYTNVSLSDKITLLKTSRKTNMDVSPLYYKEATFAILVNVCYPFVRITPFNFGHNLLGTREEIQNLDVYWEPIDRSELKEHEFELLNWDPPIRRGLCRVFYKWIPGEQGSLKPFKDGDLRTFAGFETVEIRVRVKPWERPPIDKLPVRKSDYKPTASDTPYKKVIPMYRQLTNELRSAFGAAELIQTGLDHYLRFQPRKRPANATKKS